MRIWYLTRSFYPYQKGGGPLLRVGQVDFLTSLGWDVEVILPNYMSNNYSTDSRLHRIPLNYSLKTASYLEKAGIWEDYLDKWVKHAFEYLKDKIDEDDILFATSGGELGMIKLASLLKKTTPCKFVVNFHDPLDYSLVNGLKINTKFHINRERQEEKYLSNADLIITSSYMNKHSLETKYLLLKNKIVNNYFGYIKKVDLSQYEKNSSEKLRIAYVGNMGELQKPELLYDIFKSIEKEAVEIFFIGDTSTYKPLHNIHTPNVMFINYMPHEEFLQFMAENIDVGFVSLTSDYLGACVPSKIYEYINLELPMIAALPEGDGFNIINDNNYGIACHYEDLDGLENAVKKLTDKTYLQQIKQNIIKDKESWSMRSKISDIDNELHRLVNGH